MIPFECPFDDGGVESGSGRGKGMEGKAKSRQYLNYLINRAMNRAVTTEITKDRRTSPEIGVLEVSFLF
jgi:hypothetical protein